MRIIGGRWRSRRLKVASGTRPSLDAHREALFNVVGPMVQGATCLDLFAGSGAMGLEALSRGARHVTFVERSRRAAGVLRSNVGSLDTDGSSSRVVVADAVRFVGGGGAREYTMAFVDPPYELCNAPRWWDGFLGPLAGVLAPDAIACCEGPERIEAPPGWSAGREGRNGAAFWSVLHPR